eukprot:CAMPEP_0198471310 /NCGR_PEP_ID=MMETSP1456-20131121/23568_1 /TAXON_ID=1461544 ORGANISM="Unidentified sp., Strain RCC1871" /NCGR_SAMPLE_ID=MMETSP1456 /ASSEMBLY_ACC=CAM_ASM_001119 /LENGTH=128 /DNA_ID=CAMNT_0044197873 /DNA_START=62 /DNA_END=448 /DNA_ORIENTATION=-
MAAAMARSRFSSGIHSSLLSSSQSIRLASAAFLWDFTASITTSSLSALAFLARAQPSSSSLSFDLRSSFSSQRCLALAARASRFNGWYPSLRLGFAFRSTDLSRFSQSTAYCFRSSLSFPFQALRSLT